MKKTLALSCILSLLLLPGAKASALPDKLRVLSLDLQNARIEIPGTPGSELSQDLRRVLETADVDVVCVQGAIDWENCQRLAQLRPGLQVLTCSAFTNAAQVAILSRAGAVLSWVDEIEGGNGFALAIVQAGSRKLAIFALQSAPLPASADPAKAVAVAVSSPLSGRLLNEVRKLQKFPQNRPDAFLLTGSRILQTAPLIDTGFQTVAPEPRIANGPEFFVLNAGFLTLPRTLNLRGLRSPVSISDFDTSSSFSSKFAYQTPLLFPGETLASLQAATAPARVPNDRLVLWAIAGGVALMFILFFLRRPRSRATQLVPLHSLNGPAGLLPADDPVRLNLLAWIKSAFLQRLITHRRELMDTEIEATRRTMVIEEKLSNLQSALQARISAYEIRIDRLEQELTAATLDNRELIRAQIELLKEKVAKAKQEHSVGRN